MTSLYTYALYFPCSSICLYIFNITQGTWTPILLVFLKITSQTWLLSFPSHHYLRSISISTLSSFTHSLLNRNGVPETGFSSLLCDLVKLPN